MRQQSRGFFGIGVYNPKHFCNYGTLQRSAWNFGATFTFTIGQRYKATASDTCKHWRHIPHFSYDTKEDFLTSKPRESVLVAVELTNNARPLDVNFVHPERAVYLLGAEDWGLDEFLLRKADIILKIPTVTLESLNLGVAGSIIMYDRYIKGLSHGSN